MTGEIREFLIEIMGRYTTENVENPIAFEKSLHEFFDMDDWEMEGYSLEEKDVQRKKSIQFHWGHNHDFGNFQIEGILGDRHIDLVEKFIEMGLPKDLYAKHVLDVGVWCGGTSLLLTGMGADISSVEEVYKYSDCFAFIAHSFGIDKYYKDDNVPKRVVAGWISIIHSSIYKHNPQNYFNYIIFPGVLYHLSDPILALRILFNALVDGGELYLETAIAGNDLPGPVCSFKAGAGNNWFVPNDWALSDMIKVVGFEDIQLFPNGNRTFLKAVRNEWKPMLQSGLSKKVR